MTCGVYAIVNLVNGHRYVGSSTNIEGRWQDHILYLNKGIHGTTYLQRAWMQHGEHNFEFSILCKCSFLKLAKMEQRFIDEKAEYNGSRIAYRVEMTPEVRHKLSLANLGKKNGPPSEETRRKISEAQKGKKLSPEHLAKLKVARQGRIISEETKAKTSASMKGNAKLKAALIGNTNASGHRHTPKELEKMRIARKKWWWEKKNVAD